MPITRKEVEEIALLARLALSEAEIDLYTRQLGDILGYIEKLRSLDTEGVEATTHAVPMDCTLREDELGERLPVEDALRAAPRRAENFFEVPRIIAAHDEE
ncbi:MAG TPA: Asp-tRNA(Asn)/Glu-tRNA(Gln) amidotransferase subunit GatC [Polyangia bacterium]|nr:Asp-tRNA(Asn)/Glu-tRNA(Gln) amidotransferase subunit GatC [Polyangia bacterium]